jgi:hypothetical protein
MENKVLVLGIGAAVVVLGGLALLLGKTKKEKEVVKEEEKEGNMDDPLTSLILWFEGIFPLFSPFPLSIRIEGEGRAHI